MKDLLGKPLSEIDHKEFYSKSFFGDIPLEEIMPTDSFELPDRKEICMVEVWKDRKKDQNIRVINIWYNSDKENTNGYNVWADNSEVSQVTRSGKGYKLAKKKIEKAVER